MNTKELIVRAKLKDGSIIKISIDFQYNEIKLLQGSNKLDLRVKEKFIEIAVEEITTVIED